MSSVQIRDVRKSFGNFEVLHGVSIPIEDGEFVVLVGPSGCGKSTLLRMLAGLENITSGTISIGDRVVNNVQPKERDIAMVFQNYALYPHMTVADNMGFSLKLRGASTDEISKGVSRAAEILALTPLLERYPRQLSGGQRQRVAMGRAIVRDPQVFLFDEPLSNLDAKLRVQMRAEIRKLQRRLGVTSLYVTHDQVEAMTLGDRLLILHEGQPAQLATPMEVFDRPADTYVAGFVGSPTMNFLPGRLVQDGAAVQLEAGPLVSLPKRLTGDKVTLGIRPEHLTLGPDGMRITVELIEPLGSETLVHGRTRDGAPLVAKLLGAAAVPDGLSVRLDPAEVHVFDRVSGVRIPNDAASSHQPIP